MENHLCICKRWSWKPITGTHWSSMERPSAGLDYWPLRFISPQSPGNYAPSPNNTHTHTQSHNSCTSASLCPDWVSTFYSHLLQKLKEMWSPNVDSDGEIKLRMNTANDVASRHHLNSTRPFYWNSKLKKVKWKGKKANECVHVWISGSMCVYVWNQVKALSECWALTW